MTGFLGVRLLSLKNTFSHVNNDDISILIRIYGIFDQMTLLLGCFQKWRDNGITWHATSQKIMGIG